MNRPPRSEQPSFDGVKPADSVAQAVDAVDLALSVDAKRARILAAKRKKEAEAESSSLDAEIERLNLEEHFERELHGKEGQQFSIYDATECGEGFFVVKLGPSILWKTYWDSQMNEVDRCDLVSACIVHPAKDAYLAARGRRMGIDAELVKHLGRLNGLEIAATEKK